MFICLYVLYVIVYINANYFIIIVYLLTLKNYNLITNYSKKIQE